MSWLNQLEVIKDTLQTAVDTTVTRIEEIHIAIANMPLEQLEKSGMTAIEKTRAKERQQELISSIYGTIRAVNAKVGELASDLFEAFEDGQHASQVHKTKEATSASPAEAAAPTPAQAEAATAEARPSPADEASAAEAPAVEAAVAEASEAPAKKGARKNA